MDVHSGESFLPVVTFGKYKGQPVTSLMNDPEYVEWCRQQEWFKTKYQPIYNICINQQITPSGQFSKTPEHNKLQNLFLDDENVKMLLKHMNNQSKNKKNMWIDVGEVIVEGKYNWDLTVEGSNWGLCSCDWDIKDENNDTRCDCETFKNFMKTRDIPQNTGFDCLPCRDYYCEIKPLLGDDYPNVLRKMRQQIELTDSYASKRNEKEMEEFKEQQRFNGRYNHTQYSHVLKHLLLSPVYVLIVKEYKSSSTTFESLVDIFARQHIKVVLLSDIILPVPVESVSDAVMVKVSRDVESDLQKKCSKCSAYEQEIEQLKDQCKRLEEENSLLKSNSNYSQPVPKTPKKINDYFVKM